MRQNRIRMRNSHHRGGRGENQWDRWIGTSLLRMCSRFCNNRGSTDPTHEEIITRAGLQTCNDHSIVNEEETYYSQGDSPAERPTPCPSYCSNEDARRNSQTHSESEYANGARPLTPGELETFRLRRPRIKPNA